jgi:hypothetical protein
LEWRKLVCGVMIVVVPVSLFAQVTDRAMLHSDGGTWLNGNPAPESSAIFMDALIQTPKEHSAKIDAEGSAATVQPETIVQFEGDELVLDHGGLQLTTERQMRVRVNCITVTPINAAWTQYDVTDVDGRVKVVAYKNDVRIHYRGSLLQKSKQGGASSDVIVHEGEQATRDERCGAAIKPADGIAADGEWLNSTAAKVGGSFIVAGLICLGVCRSPNPISPTKP